MDNEISHAATVMNDFEQVVGCNLRRMHQNTKFHKLYKYLLWIPVEVCNNFNFDIKLLLIYFF
jgi:hypothetical protein